MKVYVVNTFMNYVVLFLKLSCFLLLLQELGFFKGCFSLELDARGKDYKRGFVVFKKFSCITVSSSS